MNAGLLEFECWILEFPFVRLRTNGGVDFAGFFGGGEFFDEGEGEVERGACASGCDDVGVDDDAFVHEGGGEFVVHGGVAGVAAGGEEAGVVEDGGRGTDGGEPAVRGGVGFDERGDSRVGSEVFHSGAAGEEEHVARGGGGGEMRGEGGVGVEGDGVAAGDAGVVGERGGDDFDVGPAEHVDGGDEFEFLESFWQ